MAAATSDRARSERRLAYMLCAPAVIAMLLVTGYPIGYAFYLSLQKFDLRFPDEKEFVDKTRFRGVVGTWRPDVDGELGVDGPVQVLVLLTADPGASPTDLAARLVDAPGAARGGAIVADHGLHQGRFPLPAAGVRVGGYRDVAPPRRGAEAPRQAAGAAQVIGEHLAHVVDVPLGIDASGSTHERTQQ